MIRAILGIRHLLYALIALVLVLCAVEVGLQIHESRTGSRVTGNVLQRLTVPCWQSHHRLRPNSTTKIHTPDTNKLVSVVTNSFGLRGSEPLVPKPAGVFRILCLGDDIIFGGEIAESETLTVQLERFLGKRRNDKVEVINGGVPDYCPLLSFLQYRSSLALLKPDLVVLNFDMTDVFDDHQYRRLTSTDQDGMPTGCCNPELENGSRTFEIDAVNRFKLAQMTRQQISRLMNPGQAERDAIESPSAAWAWLRDDAPDWRVHTRNALGPIVMLQRQLQMNSIPMILAVSPAPWQVSAEAGSDRLRKTCGVSPDVCWKSRRPFDLLQAVAEKYQIPFFDASKSFERINESHRLFLAESRCFSRYGHALYAHDLSAFISQLIPEVRDSGEIDVLPVSDSAIVR